MKAPKLYKDLNQKDLLSILFFILPGLKDRIKPVKMNMKKSIWGERYTQEYNDSNKSLYIRRWVTRGSVGDFDKLIPEAIKIKPNWDLEYRNSVYKGESRSSVYYTNEWNTPDNILKVYKYISSLGYIVEPEE